MRPIYYYIRTILLLTVCFFISYSSWAQGTVGAARTRFSEPVLKTYEDTLRGELKQRDLPDSARLKTLRKLSYRLIKTHSPAALGYAQQAVSLALKLQRWHEATLMIFNVIIICTQQADYVMGTRYSQLGIDVARQHQTNNEWHFYEGLAMMAGDSKDYPASVGYLRQAYHLQSRSRDVPDRQRGTVLMNFANSFLGVNQYDSVLYYSARGLVFLQRIHDPRGVGGLYQLRGAVFQKRRPRTAASLDSSIANLRKALAVLRPSQYRDYATDIYPILSDSYRLRGMPEAAKQVAIDGIRMAAEQNSPRARLESLYCLAWAYADLGQSTSSFDYNARANSLRDSLFNTDKTQELAQLQAKFGMQQQQQQLSLLAEQNHVVVEHSRTVEAQAQAQRARLALLTQEHDVSAAQSLVQVTRLALLTQQQAGAEAQAQAQRSRLALLTQQKLSVEVRQQAQRSRLNSVIVLVVVLGLLLLLVSHLYLRLVRRRRELAEANAQLAHASERDARAAAEKEVLIQEIHHRVKNNLQVVSALLSWQSDRLPHPALVAVLATNRARIQSMALVHESLYRINDFTQVHLDEYLPKLLDSLHDSLTSSDQPIKFTTDLAPIVLEAKDAGTFGLLVTELVINAVKHAFRGRAAGHLHVSLDRRPAGFRLCVTDDGVGLPPTGLQSSGHSLGSELIYGLAGQLHAKVFTAPNVPTGTRIEILST